MRSYVSALSLTSNAGEKVVRIVMRDWMTIIKADALTRFQLGYPKLAVSNKRTVCAELAVYES